MDAKPKYNMTTDSEARKGIPLARGCFDYFPAALAAVARLSARANAKHNPGEEMHWARGKSDDHADCLLRHLADRGTVDTDGDRHSTKVAWRALALLQLELEREEGAPMPRGAREPVAQAYAPAGEAGLRHAPAAPETALPVPGGAGCWQCAHDTCPSNVPPCKLCSRCTPDNSSDLYEATR